MRRNYVRCLAVLLILVMTLGGCGMHKLEEKGPDPSLPFGDVAQVNGWRDNSLDAFSAVFIATAMPSQLEEGFSYGGWNIVLSDTRAYVLQKHLCLEDYTKAWDELITVNGMGEVEREKLSLSFTPESNNQIVRMGRVWGNDHLVCANVENGEHGTFWRVFELDENLKPQWDFIVNFLTEGVDYFPECVTCDKAGNVHLAFRPTEEDGPLTHYVAGRNGIVLDSFPLEGSEDDVDYSYEWTFSPNGNLLIKQMAYRNGVKLLERAYLGASGEGLGRMLLERRPDPSKSDYVKYAVLDENVARGGDRAFVFADETGVYYGDARFERKNPLYVWSNHGISVRTVMDVRSYENGNIGIFYIGDDGECYMVLQPTTEQVEMTEITLAVSKGRKLNYEAIVNEFNRKNPAWRVRIVTSYDEDEPRLLAELGTGKGPVLVDTLRLGFENQKMLWEPLDELLESANLNDVLLEGIMEGCRIGGVTYGVVLDCQLETMITREGITPENWDYEGLLRHADDPNLKALYQPYDVDSRGFLSTYVMMHGLDDNYLINADDAKNCIDKIRLEKVLDIEDRLCNNLDLQYDWVKAFQQGEMLFDRIALLSFEGVTNLRNKYGKDISFVGLPTKDGGRHLFSAVIPLSIRVTATDQEKEVARAFLLEALSYEGQKTQMERNYNFGISVRKDLFEYQIEKDVDDYLYLARQAGQNLTEDSLQEDVEIWKGLVNTAVAKRTMPQEVKDILDEEFDAYFQNNITREQLLDHLQNRVYLYLSE